MKVFSIERPIRFSQCDPAGLLYFANIYNLINAIVEDWFDRGLRFPFEVLMLQRRYGLPIVKNTCEFIKPLRMGERLTLELVVERLGRSSIEFLISGKVSGEDRFRARHKVAMVSLENTRSIEIPADLRERIAEYVAP